MSSLLGAFDREEMVRNTSTIATHVIQTGYGHWLPNDPRGSESRVVHAPRIAELGEIHFGRKQIQPSREELRAFHRLAEERLGLPVLWFNGAERQALVEAFGQVIAANGLTCYACALLHDHAHFLIRRHRLRAQAVSEMLKRAGRDALRQRRMAPADHPVFGADACHLYKTDPGAVRACVEYIDGNFAKHGLPFVRYPFVVPYDNWPLHKHAR